MRKLRLIPPDVKPEIIIDHDPTAGPVTHVKNLLLQFSIGQLQAAGYYERYAKLMKPAVLQDLLGRLAPGWVPVELAMAHYEACEKLELTSEQIEHLGQNVGDRVQNAALVSAAKRSRAADFEIWSAIPQMHRMWARVYQGGSVQVSKLSETDQLIVRRGVPMNRFRYYCEAQLGVIKAAFAALGTEITCCQTVDSRPENDELSIHVGWD